MATDFTTAGNTRGTLVRGHFVQMLFKEKTAPSPGGAPRPAATPSSLEERIRSAEGRGGILEIGQPLVVLESSPSQRQIDIYSGVRPLSIYSDRQWV